MNTTSFSLTVSPRNIKKQSAREARKNNLVPGVMYGHNFKTLAISVPYSDLLRTYRQAGESALINLSIDKKKVKALIHNITLHPVKRTIHHIDFYVVNLKEETDVSIPFNFIGESPAVKNKGGILIKEFENVQLRCLPSEIPSEIKVSLENLKEINDSILLSDLDINTEKYEIMDLFLDTPIVSVLAPRIESETEEVSEENQSVEPPLVSDTEETQEK